MSAHAFSSHKLEARERHLHVLTFVKGNFQHRMDKVAQCPVCCRYDNEMGYANR